MALKKYGFTARDTIRRLRKEIRNAKKEISLIGPRKRRSNRVEKLEKLIASNQEIIKELTARKTLDTEGRIE